jgi:hypothetical protein
MNIDVWKLEVDRGLELRLTVQRLQIRIAFQEIPARFSTTLVDHLAHRSRRPLLSPL